MHKTYSENKLSAAIPCFAEASSYRPEPSTLPCCMNGTKSVVHIYIAIGCSLFVLNHRAEHSGTENIRCFFVEIWPKIHFVETAFFSHFVLVSLAIFFSLLAYLSSTNIDAIANLSFTIVTTVTEASYLTDSKYFRSLFVLNVFFSITFLVWNLFN